MALDEKHARAMTRRRNRRGQSARPTTDHDNIHVSNDRNFTLRFEYHFHQFLRENW
jgi:hypothetical protein